MIVYPTNFDPKIDLDKYLEVAAKYPGKAWVYDYPMPWDGEREYHIQAARDAGLYCIACTSDIYNDVWEDIMSW